VLNAADDGASGTGVVTLTALANHASQTINMTAATDVAVKVTVADASTATAYTVNASGAGTFIFVGDSNTSAIDTYNGGAGVDDVTPGGGGDIISLGAGSNDIVRITLPAHTGIAAGIVAGGAAPANGTTINVAAMDKISGLSAGDTIRFTGAAADMVVNNTAYTILRNGQTLGANNTNNVLMLTGTYDAATGLFTVSTGGNSTLLCYDDNGIQAGGDYRGVVLVGYVDTGGTDTVVGTGTTVLTFTVVGG
jgi:hypothetical protein